MSRTGQTTDEQRAEADALQKRVDELEAQLARLREQTALMSSALEQLPASVELLDERGRILHVNEAFERLTGIDRREAVGHTPVELFGAEPTSDTVHAGVWAALAEGKSWTGLLPARVRSGELRQLETRLSPVLSEGAPMRFVVVRSDVTEQQDEAARLRDSNELYLQVFRNNSAIKLMVDPRSALIVDANPAAEAFYGYTIDELRGMPIHCLNTMAPAQIAQALIEADALKKTSFRFLHRLKSGEQRMVEVFTGPVEVGGQRLLLSIIQDVTDRERAEKELMSSEARFRTLIEHAPVGVAVHRQGIFVYLNPPAVRLLGFERAEDVIGTEVISVVHPDDRAMVRERVLRLSAGEHMPMVEERFLRRDGGLVVAEIMALPLQFDGQPSVIVTVNDVTERRRLEEQLLRAQRMEAVGRLAGGVAHDFNNLLFVILNASAFLRKRLPEGSSALHDAEQIRAAAQRAANLTRQLLLFARGTEPLAEVLDVNVVAAGLRDLLERTLGESIELRFSLGPAPCWAKLAKDHLEQVLVNLAVNARDAMPLGGTLGIEVSQVELEDSQTRQMLGVAPGPHVRVAVSDTGVGMSPEVAAHAFEPFFTTKEHGTGTGLGLSITYGIVQKAGGHIAIESVEGQGTRVVIHLPAAAAEASAHQSGPPVPPERAGHGEAVLVVEDDAPVRQMLERILSGAGYQVLLASGPGEALLLAEQHQGELHLLLTDITLPRMSGPALARRLCGVRPSLRVLYMTGYAGDGLAPARDDTTPTLPKPFDELMLLTQVRRVLGG